MVRRCVIEGCESKSTLPQHQGVTFHSFPFDSKTRDIWIENCHLPANKNITKNILVCSRHFRRADFQPMKSGKYLLKNGACPSVFPWKKTDSSSSSLDSAPVSRVNSEVSENTTASTVEATIAQIMAETAELNRAAGIIAKESKRKASRSEDFSLLSPRSQDNSPLKIDATTAFTPGVRLEVQEINGQWHSGKVVEVDNDDQEVLIKFEKSAKSKRTDSEEWIPMNSPRLRQRSAKLTHTFIANEKCFARWTGSRKFPATVQKVLADDLYEVLFEDGFIKTVRGGHMSKIKSLAEKSLNLVGKPPKIIESKIDSSDEVLPSISERNTKKSKQKKNNRKDWPLISMNTLDLASLNLPKVPKDGEWTCHWVNDQPIGREGFLLIGEHKKPTVIVDDWRLPPGWVKHMYQRSNVLGKWDVILVNPSGKRFRSKADLKQALEDAGQVYNPDIYDFSIHRRRAKDINAYVYTADYKLPPKTAFISSCSQDPSAVGRPFSLSSFPESPVVTTLPPVELITPPQPTPKTKDNSIKAKEPKEHKVKDVGSSSTEEMSSPVIQPFEDGYAYIGGLKVQIVDNLFRCPQEGCSKNFRKENHLQIHIKHYHRELIKHLGACPNMQDLALKRTIGHPDSEPHPKNQIPNQQFFAKMHQQDLEHSRSHRKSSYAMTPVLAVDSQIHTTILDDNSCPTPAPASTGESMDVDSSKDNLKLDSSYIGSEVSLDKADTQKASEPSITSTFSMTNLEPVLSNLPAVSPETKKSKLLFIKKPSYTVARKSNRQRTTKKYLTATHATTGPALVPAFEDNFEANDFEENRHNFNTTPDKPATTKKPKLFPIVASDSTNTADGSVTMSCFPDLSDSPKYIKENGELIKIVRMRQEEIINCLCSYGEEDGLMIQCELCLCWQHGSCNGIDKESDVPDKYVCYICRNPQRGRESRKYIHDQDWMYDGKLPAANYHEENPMHPERFEILKKSHTLSGNIIELKRFLHSLQVKINIAENKGHPKMYLWEKRWDLIPREVVKVEGGIIKTEDIDVEMKDLSKEEKPVLDNQEEKVKTEPHIPQPETPIDPVECQYRLLEHIKVQQGLVMNRLEDIEADVNELEGLDNLIDLKSENLEETKDILASFIKDLTTMKALCKINSLANVRNSNLVIIK